MLTTSFPPGYGTQPEDAAFEQAISHLRQVYMHAKMTPLVHPQALAATIMSHLNTRPVEQTLLMEISVMLLRSLSSGNPPPMAPLMPPPQARYQQYPQAQQTQQAPMNPNQSDASFNLEQIRVQIEESGYQPLVDIPLNHPIAVLPMFVVGPYKYQRADTLPFQSELAQTYMEKRGSYLYARSPINANPDTEMVSNHLMGYEAPPPYVGQPMNYNAVSQISNIAQIMGAQDPAQARQQQQQYQQYQQQQGGMWGMPTAQNAYGDTFV